MLSSLAYSLLEAIRKTHVKLSALSNTRWFPMPAIRTDAHLHAQSFPRALKSGTDRIKNVNDIQPKTGIRPKMKKLDELMQYAG